MLNNKREYPEPKADINFHLPKINKLNFKNSLPIYFIPKNSLPIIQIGLVINSGSKFDNIDKLGTAKLTSMVIDEGAGEYNALELDNEFESLGTVFDISVDKDSTIVTMLSLTENFKKSFGLLAKILKEPHFNETDFNREKEKLKTQLLQLKDEPEYLANSAFEKIVFQDTPYSNPVRGTNESLEKLTVNDLKEFYSNYYGINNAELIVVGNITQVDLLSVLEEQLSDWREVNILQFGIPKFKDMKKNIFVINRDNTPQTEIRIGHISGERKSSDFFAKSLMNTILGGQFTSRINLNLRENKGFTYGAHSAFNYNKSFGQFVVSTSVKAENTGEAINEILKEIENVQKDVTAEEIEFAKSYLIKRFPAKFETYSQLVRNMALLSIHSLPMDYYNNYVNAMSAVTVEDVLSAAKDNLHINSMSFILVGDKNRIAQQIDSPYTELDLNGNVVSN